MRGRVMLYVQHLLGIGHLKRAAVIARSLAAQDMEVWVVLGGPEVDAVSFAGCARILLPAVRAADATFATLVDEEGRPVDDALREARVARLLSEFEAIRPDVLLIEQFPFGRRAFRFELMPLLAQARATTPRPSVLSSVRDVLVRKADPQRSREMTSLARMWFDGVLVHGDPDVCTLEDSFPQAAEIRPLIRYTGYVVDPPLAGEEVPEAGPGTGGGDRATGGTGSDRAATGRLGAGPGGKRGGEVVVSAGGGAVGAGLLKLALDARPLTSLARVPWRLICGLNMPPKEAAALAWDPPSGVIVQEWCSDLPAILRNCVLSISQAGYNTVLDIIQARARAVVVPFAEGAQTEQEFRARLFERRGLLRMVDPRAATAETLATAVDAAMRSESVAHAIDVSGAATTTQVIAALCDQRRC